MQPTKQTRKWDAVHIGLAAVCAVLVIIAIWMAVGRAGALRQVAREGESVRQEFREILAGAEVDATGSAASAFASGIAPIVALRGQVPEISERTLQQTVASLVESGDYAQVEVLDASGLVLASSDLARIGQQGDRTAPAASESRDGDQIRVVRPVMSGDNRVGTLLMVRRA